MMKTNDCETIAANCFDLEKVLLVPRSEVSSVLLVEISSSAFMNIMSLPSQGYCFIWPECEGGHRCNECSNVHF